MHSLHANLRENHILWAVDGHQPSFGRPMCATSRRRAASPSMSTTSVQPSAALSSALHHLALTSCMPFARRCTAMHLHLCCTCTCACTYAHLYVHLYGCDPPASASVRARTHAGIRARMPILKPTPMAMLHAPCSHLHLHNAHTRACTAASTPTQLTWLPHSHQHHEREHTRTHVHTGRCTITFPL